MNDSLTASTFKNIGYNILAKGISFLFQSAASIVLARNLLSSDYGIVGFAMIFINFLYQFSDIGIGSAVIQKSELDEKGLYTGFTIKLILGICIFVISIIIAPLSRLFFDDPAVVNVIKLLSLSFIINSLGFLPNILLNRELDFKKLLFAQIGLSIANAIISISLVLNGFTYWSIVIANVGSNFIFVIILNIIRPVKLKLYLDKKYAADFIRFGTSLFFSGIIIFAIFNMDNFIIGTIKGSDSLGYYAIAFNWGSMICAIMGSIILSVLFPTFSRIQRDNERINRAYLRVLEYQSFIALMVNASMLIVSKEFLFFILGQSTEKWLPALTAFRILCIYGIIRTILEPIGSVILALGKPKILLHAQILIAVIEIGLLYPALHFFDIAGVATVVTVAYFSAYIVIFRIINQDIKLSFSEWFKPVYPALVSSSIAFAAAYALKLFLSFSFMGMLQQFSFFVISYCIIYGILTRWKMVHDIKSLLFKPGFIQT